jgi:lysophospholipase L1-like esterase/pimeloyl-ACP methyl ester carboxylesterase
LAKALTETNPEWVVFCYGMNDGIYYPFSEERFQAYKSGILKLITMIKDAEANAIALTPPPFDPEAIDVDLLPEGEEKYSYLEPYENYNDVLATYSQWILNKLNDIVDKVIDIYNPINNYINSKRKTEPNYKSGDGIHPNHRGHWLIAKKVLRELFNICLELVPDYVNQPEDSQFFKHVLERQRVLSSAWKQHVGHSNVNKDEALSLNKAVNLSLRLEEEISDIVNNKYNSNSKQSSWQGYQRHDFYYKGREVIIIIPEEPASGNPWVWRAEFFGAFPQVDLELLEKGWYLVYYRISNLYGCPESVTMMKDFHNFITQSYSLAPKAALFGFSRGGLYAFNYTADYPETVSVLYLDAPVLDIRSWPAGYGEGQGGSREWEECKAVYGLTDEDEKDFNENFLNKIEEVAKADIPIIVVAGDSDKVVPLSENAGILIEKYKDLGGKIESIIKQGVGHHPHSLKEPKKVVDFILERSSLITILTLVLKQIST